MKLRDIIHQFGDKSYPVIDILTTMKQSPRARKKFDVLLGYCKYDAETQILTVLHGDGYTLDDNYIKWEEETDEDGTYLNVWY